MNNQPNYSSQNTPVQQHSVQQYDVVVIGAGGNGSAAAYHCAARGQNVLLAEQFEVGHQRGSSHGDSRIVRYTHDTVDYAQQMPETFALWRKLEAESGVDLMQMTGGLYMGGTDDPFLVGCKETLAKLQFPHRLLDAHELRKEWPQFNPRDDWFGLYQEHSGILSASLCVQTMVVQAVRHGATLREKTRVVSVLPNDDGVQIQLAGPDGAATVYADQVIIAAGSWAGHFLDSLVSNPIPLRITHQQVAYYPVHNPADFSVGTFPLFIIGVIPHFYGFPIWGRDGTVKVSVEQTERTVNPDDDRPVDQALLDKLSDLVATFMNGVEPTPVHAEVCLYTQTPTYDFIIDRHPEHPQILFAAGFSGRGFKHTIAIGQLLADLASSEPDCYDSPFWLDQYRITRFQQ